MTINFSLLLPLSPDGNTLSDSDYETEQSPKVPVEERIGTVPHSPTATSAELSLQTSHVNPMGHETSEICKVNSCRQRNKLIHCNKPILKPENSNCYQKQLSSKCLNWWENQLPPLLHIKYDIFRGKKTFICELTISNNNILSQIGYSKGTRRFLRTITLSDIIPYAIMPEINPLLQDFTNKVTQINNPRPRLQAIH